MLTKSHVLYFSFKDDDGKIIKKENVKCIIKSPKGEVLDELKIKRTKKQTKFKYNFSKHRKKVKLTVIIIIILLCLNGLIKMECRMKIH